MECNACVFSSTMIPNVLAWYQCTVQTTIDRYSDCCGRISESLAILFVSSFVVRRSIVRRSSFRRFVGDGVRNFRSCCPSATLQSVVACGCCLLLLLLLTGRICPRVRVSACRGVQIAAHTAAGHCRDAFDGKAARWTTDMSRCACCWTFT